MTSCMPTRVPTRPTQFPEEYNVPEVAGARALMLDHTGNLHSIYRESNPMTGGLYWYVCWNVDTIMQTYP